MPYAPGVENHAGEYIARGIEQAGRAIGQGFQQMHERHAESDYLDGVGQYYFGDDPDKYAKFREGSVGTKRGMVTGMQAQQAQQMQKQQRDFQQWQATDSSQRGWAEQGRQQSQDDMLNWERTDASQRAWQGMSQKEDGWKPSDDAMKAASDAGYLYLPQSPRSGTFVPTGKNKSTAPALGSDPTGTGNFYFDGSRLKPVPTQALPADVRSGVETTQSQMDNVDRQIRDAQGEISAGNVRHGPDWLPVGKTYEQDVNDLNQRRSDLSRKMNTLRQTGGRTPMATGVDMLGAPGGAQPATPAPTAPTPAGAAPAKFTPGGVYKDGSGNRAKFNADGSWSPLGDATPAATNAPAGSVASTDTGDPDAAPVTPQEMAQMRRSGQLPKPTHDQYVPDYVQGAGDDTVSYIKGLEGYTPSAYADGAQTSVGYGTRARSSKERLSEPEAAQRLGDELTMHASRIDSAASGAGLDLTPNQRTALISYDYNTGKGVDAIKSSKGNVQAIASHIAHGPTTQDGKVLPGLVSRRASEAQLFMGSVASR